MPGGAVKKALIIFLDISGVNIILYLYKIHQKLKYMKFKGIVNFLGNMLI